MQRFGLLIFFLLSLRLFAACTPSPAPPIPATDLVWTAEANPAPLETEAPGVDPTDGEPGGDPTHEPTRTPGPPPERTTYTLAAVLDFTARTLEVQETIVFPNRTGTDLPALVLVVDAAREAGVFELVDLHIPHGPAPERWTLADGVLTIELAAPLAAGAALTLEIDYRLSLPRRPSRLGAFNSQLNLGDWYPMFPATREGAAWLAHPAHIVGETIVYPLADFEVLLEVRNAPESLVVAASGPIERTDNDYQLQAAGYRNVTFSLSDRFVVSEAQAGDVRVLGYAYREQETAAAMALGTAARAIEIFSELFGPYPHATYTIVAGNFPDGLEFDGLTYVSVDYYHWYDGTPTNYLPLLTAHEAAHQWWYGRVGNDPALEPWVDEALAIYSEVIFMERVHPEVPAEWWWLFRLEEFRPLGGYVDDTVYDHGSYRPYVNAVYLRGAELMRDLRAAMGDEAFLAALREYAERFDAQVATGNDLTAVLQAHSEADLAAIFDLYFGP